jgi:hypothetical protein
VNSANPRLRSRPGFIRIEIEQEIRADHPIRGAMPAIQELLHPVLIVCFVTLPTRRARKWGGQGIKSRCASVLMLV